LVTSLKVDTDIHRVPGVTGLNLRMAMTTLYPR
jgi:hypothetical protein